jgi:hypothetical protein
MRPNGAKLTLSAGICRLFFWRVTRTLVVKDGSGAGHVLTSSAWIRGCNESGSICYRYPSPAYYRLSGLHGHVGRLKINSVRYTIRSSESREVDEGRQNNQQESASRTRVSGRVYPLDRLQNI